MGRLSVPNSPQNDWLERLLWTSFAVGLIVLMLLGLVSLAQWGERSRVAGSGPLGIDRLPASTPLAGEMLIPPYALEATRAEPMPAKRVPLPSVSASLEAASPARFQRAALWRCKRVPGVRTRQAVELIEHNDELCEPAR